MKILLQIYLFFISVMYALSITGDGTIYTNGFSNSDGGEGFNCGFLWLPPRARTHFAAIPKVDYKGAGNCGRCAIVKCDDSRCGTYKKEVKVMIVDSCPICKSGDLDFSLPAWNDVTNNYNPDRFKISWEWALCDGDFIDGNIKMNMDSGANPWYASIQFANTNYGIKSARIGKTMSSLEELQRRDNNFFFKSLANPLQTMPFYAEFTDLNGKKYSNSFNEYKPGKIYDFGKASGGDSPSPSPSPPSPSPSPPSPSPSPPSPSPPSPTPSPSPSGESFSGFATYFGSTGTAFTNSDGGKDFNCGFMWIPTKARSYFVGINKTQYENSAQCGRCVKIKCADDRCGTNKKEVVAYIADSCLDCNKGDLNLSLQTWNDVTNKYNPDKFKIKWEFIDSCEAFVEGNIRMGIDKGSNIWYASISISNTHYGVKSARIGLSRDNLEELSRRNDNYFFKSLKTPLQTTPFYVEFTDLKGTKYINKFDDYTPGKVYTWNIATQVKQLK